MIKPVIIGGATIDIKGKPFNKLVPGTSNAGLIEKTTGGVGFNICLNLAKLGLKPSLVTLIGNDAEGKLLKSICKTSNIDTSSVSVIKDEVTATYHAIIDEDGGLFGAIAAMNIFDKLTPEILSQHEEMLLKAPFIIADTNPPPETLEYISDLCFNNKIPLWIEPASSDKAWKILGCLKGITYLSPNTEELEVLVGRSLNDNSELISAGAELKEKGVQNVFITCDKDGVIWISDNEVIHRKNKEEQVTDTTGAGDAFVAGTIWSLSNGFTIKESINYGMCAAILTIDVYESVNPFLNEELLKSTLKELKFYEL